MYTEESNIFFILIASLIVVAIVIGYFQYSMKVQYRGYLRLQRLHERAKIEAQEAERQTIAADLHDEVGPILSATNFKLCEVVPDSERGRQLLGEAQDHIKQVFHQLKRMSSLLVPRSLSIGGPLYGMDEFLNQYMRPLPLEVELKAVNCKELGVERSLHLFRMLQEILHNAIRHSKATQLLIAGEKVGDRLIIHTSDNGVGFNYDPTGKQNGHGLQNLAIRAGMIGAEVTTESAPGAGTKYKIELPLNPGK